MIKNCTKINERKTVSGYLQRDCVSSHGEETHVIGFVYIYKKPKDTAAFVAASGLYFEIFLLIRGFLGTLRSFRMPAATGEKTLQKRFAVSML